MVREARREARGSPRVGLFLTCLADAVLPSIGSAAIALPEAAGCRVEVQVDQTCCGQPALDSGDREGARPVAIALLEPFDHVVVPFESCAAAIGAHYRELFNNDPAWHARAEAVAGCTYELLSYLVDIRGWLPEPVARSATATYHDSCSGLREFGIETPPRRCSRMSRACRCARSKAARPVAASAARFA